jgi:chromosome segregation ATPase
LCTRWESVGVVRNPKPLRLICVAVLLAVAACTFQDDPAIPALADEERPSPSEAPARADGSLAALTAEIRQLRLAVEEMARSQSETQALTVYLSAQQSRMQLADQQLAAVREQVASSTAVRQDLETRLARMLADQARAAPDRRAQIEDVINELRAEQARIDLQLQEARSRENDLSRAVQSEETRFNELITRLEQLAR